jgi:hypothetical protein
MLVCMMMLSVILCLLSKIYGRNLAELDALDNGTGVDKCLSGMMKPSAPSPPVEYHLERFPPRYQNPQRHDLKIKTNEGYAFIPVVSCLDFCRA